MNYGDIEFGGGEAIVIAVTNGWAIPIVRRLMIRKHELRS